MDPNTRTVRTKQQKSKKAQKNKNKKNKKQSITPLFNRKKIRLKKRYYGYYYFLKIKFLHRRILALS